MKINVYLSFSVSVSLPLFIYYDLSIYLSIYLSTYLYIFLKLPRESEVAGHTVITRSSGWTFDPRGNTAQ